MASCVRRLRVRCIIGLMLMAGLPGAQASAAGLEASVSEQAPPAELPAAIQETLAAEKITVSKDGAAVAEIWFPREAPSGGAAGMALGINFSRFPLGGLLGVIRLHSSWNDYKNFPVPAGLYTLRYGEQPADGNHTGITVYRDYAMLIPYEEDVEEPPYSQPDLNRLSREATGTPHPAIMALFPIWDEVEGIQIVANEIDQPTLVWHAGGLQVGFVLEGHGELEGY